MIDHKTFDFEFEVKKGGDGPLRFEGYGSVFGNEDRGGDIVMPGAFTKSLQGRKTPVRMFWNHKWDSIPIGKWLNIEEDSKGLHVVGELTPGNSVASDVAAAFKHGTVDRASIGYVALEHTKSENGGRALHELDLREVSVVNFPMNELAEIAGIKAQVETLATLKDAESLLRDAVGMSKSEAVAFVSRLKSVILSDSEAQSRAVHEASEAKARNTERVLALINHFSIKE